MPRIMLLLLALWAASVMPALAQHVKGYTRSDGTYVQGYERRDRGVAKVSNYSQREGQGAASGVRSSSALMPVKKEHLDPAAYKGAKVMTTSASPRFQAASVPGVKRDHHGKIARSQTAKNDFKATHPCPSTHKSGACPGYVIDHIMALKRGGADDPSNMQWQTIAAAKAKDRWE